VFELVIQSPQTFAGQVFVLVCVIAAVVPAWAREDLRLSFLLAGLRTAWGDAWVDLARKRLALGEGCSTVNEEGAVDGHAH
jgi:hypothetical protein